MTNPFFTFLATAKTKSNPVYTSSHACLTFHEICQQSKPIRSAWCYIYILSTSDKWHLTVSGSSYCILWLLCVFCPLVVLCRIMFDKWKLIPQLVYFHFAITLNSIPPPKCFSNHTSEVHAELKDPFTEFVFQDFLNCRRQAWNSLNFLSFLFKWNTPLLFHELNGLNLSMFVSLFKLWFLV